MESSSGTNGQQTTEAASSEEVNGANGAISGSRKRGHPGALNIDETAPPNKRLHTPTKEERESIMREKQMLYKRLAEAEKNPFFLHPHQQTILPFLPFSTGKCLSPIYSFMPSPTRGSSPFPISSAVASTQSTITTQASPSAVTSVASGTSVTSGTLVGGMMGVNPGSITSPPNRAYPSQFYSPFMKYPFSPPTPSNLSGLGLLSPWNPNSSAAAVASATLASPNPGRQQNGNSSVLQNLPVGATSTPREGSNGTSGRTSGAAEDAEQKQSRSGPQNPSSPATWSSPTISALQLQANSNGGGGVPNGHSIPSTASIQHLLSPRSNFQSIPSPLNYFHHPSPLSPMMFIQSPYASSISSCPSVSSSSGCSSDGSMSRSKHYAPSEYHVGPRRPIIERYADEDDQSEGATNSGRNTPNDDTEDDSNVILPSEVGVRAIGPSSLIQSGSAPYTPLSTSMLAQSATTASQQQIPPPQQQQQQQQQSSSNSNHSPYPFSVESLSCGQPSSVGSTSQGYLASCHPTGSVERPSSGISSMSSSLSSRDSTPDPDDRFSHDQLKLECGGQRGSDAFCLVPGRLSLLSSTQKYKVSVDEVRRRLSHPECLNASVLGGILRRAKSKNGGHVLRQRLGSIGVSLPPGRRKATELSLLTSLVEGEALHLSSDFRRLCENVFPQAELAQIIARQHTGTPQAQDRISMVKATQLIVSEMQAMLNAVGGPSNIKPMDPNNPYPGLTNFSLLSHGFGTPAINSSLGVLQNYLQELLAFYEGRKPIQPDSRYTFAEKLPPAPPVNGMQNHLYGMGSQSNLMQNSDPAAQHKPSLTLKQEPMDSPNSCAL